jgi:hypothetical protein
VRHDRAHEAVRQPRTAAIVNGNEEEQLDLYGREIVGELATIS